MLARRPLASFGHDCREPRDKHRAELRQEAESPACGSASVARLSLAWANHQPNSGCNARQDEQANNGVAVITRAAGSFSGERTSSAVPSQQDRTGNGPANQLAPAKP